MPDDTSSSRPRLVTKHELLAELQDDIVGSRGHARNNYYLAYACFVVALLTTGLGVIFNTIDASNAFLRGLFTAIPGVVVTFGSTLKFQEKSRWYWHRIRCLEAMVRRLKFGDEDPVPISREFSELNLKLEESWPTFTGLPGAGGQDPSPKPEPVQPAGGTRPNDLS
jgi:hypothetical protein